MSIMMERIGQLRIEKEQITLRFQKIVYCAGLAGLRFSETDVSIWFVQQYLGEESVRRIAAAYAAGKLRWKDSRRPSR